VARMDRLERALELDLGMNSRGCLRRGWTGWNGVWSWTVKEFSRLPAKRMDRLELALEPNLGRNFRGCLWRGWTGWNGLWNWIWAGIFEAACGKDGQAGMGTVAKSGKEFPRLPVARMDKLERALELDLGRNSRGCLRRGWLGWKGIWSWIWEGVLEAACGEDGQAGTGSGAGSGQEFSRLPAGRMDRLEQVLELDLGRSSRSCLRRGWTGWNWLWTWIWEGIFEVACGEDGQAGTGSGAGSGKEFSRLPVERLDWLHRALEPTLGRRSRGCLRKGWTGLNGVWSWIWEGILEAVCGEDGQAGTSSGAGSEQELSRLPAERMDRLELALEPVLGRNSQGCLRKGWTGWTGVWNWIWAGIFEAACGKDGQAGTGSGTGSGNEFSRLPAERMDRLERALELDLGRNSRSCLRRGLTGWNGL